jgi:ABC-type lipoprotein release transport system permease subunit
MVYYTNSLCSFRTLSYRCLLFSTDPPQPASSVNTSIIAIAVTLGVLVLIMVVSMVLHRQGKCKKEQTYGIDLPPISVNVRKPHA